MFTGMDKVALAENKFWIQAGFLDSATVFLEFSKIALMKVATSFPGKIPAKS